MLCVKVLADASASGGNGKLHKQLRKSQVRQRQTIGGSIQCVPTCYLLAKIDESSRHDTVSAAAMVAFYTKQHVNQRDPHHHPMSDRRSNRQGHPKYQNAIHRVGSHEDPHAVASAHLTSNSPLRYKIKPFHAKYGIVTKLYTITQFHIPHTKSYHMGTASRKLHAMPWQCVKHQHLPEQAHTGTTSSDKTPSYRWSDYAKRSIKAISHTPL